MSLAFQSVQLLASDYMSSLPPPLLHKCLHAAALYGGQQVGVQINDSTSYSQILMQGS